MGFQHFLDVVIVVEDDGPDFGEGQHPAGAEVLQGAGGNG